MTGESLPVNQKSSSALRDTPRRLNDKNHGRGFNPLAPTRADVDKADAYVRSLFEEMAKAEDEGRDTTGLVAKIERALQYAFRLGLLCEALDTPALELAVDRSRSTPNPPAL